MTAVLSAKGRRRRRWHCPTSSRRRCPAPKPLRAPTSGIWFPGEGERPRKARASAVVAKELGPPRGADTAGRAQFYSRAGNEQNFLIADLRSVIPLDLMRSPSQRRPFDSTGGRSVPCPEENSPC